MRALRIAHITSEITPFAKTGGLADVAAALPAYLHRAGHDVRVFTPKHAVIDAKSYEFEPVERLAGLSVSLGDEEVAYDVVRSPLPGSGLGVYFVDCPALYDRPAIYSDEPDEHRRFTLLSRAALDSCRRLGWAPDVIHCHDWQTGLVPLYLKTLYAWDEMLRSARTILTIHNIGYQGRFPAAILPDTGLEEGAKYFFQEDLAEGVVGFLKTGILYADRVTTVSPTYAEEIRTEPFGAGLHELMRERGQTLVGILNGVDTDVWNPATDEHLPVRYSRTTVEWKEKNKELLLADLQLPYEKEVPLLGMVTRLTGQKGLDLVFDPLQERLAAGEARIVVLGSGESRYERRLAELQEAFPDRVRFLRGFHEGLAHRIEAAADLFLMPSIYEPCGLNQMYSLIYGTIPIVRKTGGLADTVRLWNPETREGNGIVFDHPTAEGVRWALKTSLALYRDSSAWRTLVRNAMDGDWSWAAAGRRYEELYEELLRTEPTEV